MRVCSSSAEPVQQPTDDELTKDNTRQVRALSVHLLPVTLLTRNWKIYNFSNKTKKTKTTAKRNNNN